MMAILVRGNAMSRADVDKAFAGIDDVDAVVSTIGGTPGDPAADSQVCKFLFLQHNFSSSFVWGRGVGICIVGVALLATGYC